MQVQMPRCRQCVLCGDPVSGKGRIDRIYCSASCRTLAWRIREGKRWGGRPNPAVTALQESLDAAQAEHARLRAELHAERQRADTREAELTAQVATLTRQQEQAEAQQRTAEHERDEAKKENAELHKDIEWRVAAHIELQLQENQRARDLADACRQLTETQDVLAYERSAWQTERRRILVQARESQALAGNTAGLSGRRSSQQRLTTDRTMSPSCGLPSDAEHVLKGPPEIVHIEEASPSRQLPAPEAEQPKKQKKAVKGAPKKQSSSMQKPEEKETSLLKAGAGLGVGLVGAVVMVKTVKGLAAKEKAALPKGVPPTQRRLGSGR